ncbi:MAG: efflux RND transporter periplasmic adaptor subunit [Candidatus Krumholzibacteriota bacterium]|nr:efflux RND transporter periplasmic adaptor subunit [Candidatus Krumholzibacteriota bacterium]
MRPTPQHPRAAGARAALVVSVILVALFVLAPGCSNAPETDEGPGYHVVPVVRQDLVVTVSASGTLEPLRSVEVKSKASGEIIAMPVELGDRVARGTQLVKVDPQDVQAQLEQAEASLEVARTRLRIAGRQAGRSEQLLAEGSISEQDHEQVLLEHAMARNEEVRARTSLDQARERVEDTEVRSPMDGTVIVKAVELGQIISSATSQVTGGTTLLTMANLDTLQVRTMVDETDIGKIRSDLAAQITVDAYPRELFNGRVVKVEPQAVTVQNVTTFPVLVRIVNDRGLLLPGMNVDVEIQTDVRENVLTVPAEALRTERDWLVAAGALGLDTQRALALWDESRAEAGEAGRFSVAFLAGPGGPRPVPVGIGIANWDYAEILWGLDEGDSVAATLSTSLLMQQERWRSRMQSMSNMGGFRRTETQESTQQRNGQNGTRPAGQRPSGTREGERQQPPARQGGQRQGGQQQGGQQQGGQQQGGGSGQQGGGGGS